jgi:hypothetical protein
MFMQMMPNSFLYIDMFACLPDSSKILLKLGTFDKICWDRTNFVSTDFDLPDFSVLKECTYVRNFSNTAQNDFVINNSSFWRIKFPF